MNNEKAKVQLLPHSEAKVRLYGYYLGIYLNILSRVSFIRKIFLFDLMCGEGKYEDGNIGSPLIALQAIKNHYYANSRSITDMEVWFNDNGESEIESGIPKIDRVKRHSENQFIPRNVRVQFLREDFNIIYPHALQAIEEQLGAKGLFFIDPYGYKNIRLSHLREILSCGDTEVLLFLPISFMYRFAEAALTSEFPGSEPLTLFLNDLAKKDKIPNFRSPYDFVNWLERRFRISLSDLGTYITSFTIERSASNLYCLFFFTSSIRGLEKMIEAKWKMDEQGGKGFQVTQQHPRLFSEVQLAQFPQKLEQYLGKKWRTNEDVWHFALQHGFLQKHANSCLRQLSQEKGLQVQALDGKSVRKNAFYIGNPTRRIQLRLIESE